MGISNTFKKMENYIKFSPYRRKLYHLRGKKIAIDTSIYMWKFKTSDHSLGIYQFVTFINLLLKYEIIPIFIMDGRPTPLKSDEIQKRKKKNREILELIRKYDESPEENPEIRKRIEKLRISSKIVTGSDWEFLEDLLDFYGIVRVRVHGREAEGYCCHLNKVHKVDYVMTEDSDVLLYGAKRWIRNINFYTCEVVIYDLICFRTKLGLYGRRLIEVGIAFGTDFNPPLLNLQNDFEPLLVRLKTPEGVQEFEKLVQNSDRYQAILEEYSGTTYELEGSKMRGLEHTPELLPVPIPNLESFKEKIPEEYLGKLFPQVIFCIKKS